MTITDFKLEQDPNTGLFDLVIANGDFATVSGIETYVDLSLLLDQRANKSEIANPERRRGWIGDILRPLINDTIGTKTWLYYQSRNTREVGQAIENSWRNSLQRLIREGYATKVDVTAVQVGEGFEIKVDITGPTGGVQSREYRTFVSTEGKTL